ncbi:MAG: DDE-type integrase/transposase/recombinase [Chromatiales bacterium]|nr:DDE-type integrase/transposase/recombinase [Chromatiales bacterium]
MVMRLHKNARTTPAIRRELQASTLPTRQLAEHYGLSRQTAAKWRGRSGTEDASHRPHRFHTRLTPAQEAVVVELCKTLLLPLDDLLAVTHEFISMAVSRSGLDRCLRRYGVSDLQALKPQPIDSEARAVKTFKDYEPGVVHVDVKYLPQMSGEDRAQYLFAAIDRATRWVYVEILPEKTAQHIADFLERLIAKAPFTITKVLANNGKERTDRFCAIGEREPTGRHCFDQICSTQSIEHSPIQLRIPQTNGMIERFNRRIAEVLTTSRFDPAERFAQTIARYVRVCNQHIPQKALSHIAPIQALKDWHDKRPELFKKRVYNLWGLDIC